MPPTQAEVETQISNVVRLFENLRNYCGVTASTNFLDNLDTLTQSVEGSYSNEVLAGAQSLRNALVSANGTEAAALAPLFLDMGMVINAPEKSVSAILTRLFEFMINSSQAVTSRQFTYGAATPDGSNVGTGAVYRITVDGYGENIENCTAEAKEITCTADQYSGAVKGEELFQFTGSDAERDNLKITGSGLVSTIRAVSSADSLIGNASWTNFSGTTSVPTSITDWLPGSDIANFEIDQVNYYVDDKKDGGSPASLKFKANDYVEQKFSVRNVTLNPSVPYYCSIFYNREIGAADGDLTLWLGDQYETVTLAAQAGWNELKIPLGVKNYLQTFNSTDPAIKVNLASNTTGTLLVDSCVFAGCQNFDGTWWQILGGATPFLYVPGTGDKFTVTDSEVAGAILQYHFWKSLGRYMPSGTGGAVTWADPT